MVLISISLVLSQTSAYTARKQVVHVCVCACSHPSVHWYSLHLTMDGWPGWVGQGGWLRTKMIYPHDNSHPTSSNFNDQNHHVTLSRHHKPQYTITLHNYYSVHHDFIHESKKLWSNEKYINLTSLAQKFAISVLRYVLCSVTLTAKHKAKHEVT